MLKCYRYINKPASDALNFQRLDEPDPESSLRGPSTSGVDGPTAAIESAASGCSGRSMSPGTGATTAALG
jgi:hypothetical protein